MSKISILIFAFLLALIPMSVQAKPVQVSECSILEKIDEDDSNLAKIPLKISKTAYSYEEERISRNQDGSVRFVSRVNLTDVEKEIAFLLLNVETCETNVIKVTKRGDKLIVPSGYEIYPVKRASGLTWNGFNTQFEVKNPSNMIVLKNAWPKEETRIVTVTKKGKNGKSVQTTQTEKYVKNIVYTLYSADNPDTSDIEPNIHIDEVVDGGALYAKSIVDDALAKLRLNKVRSKAFPDQIVGDSLILSPEVYVRLLYIEQTDYNEFLKDKQKSIERVSVILRANRTRAYTSCNSTKPWRACGPFQFTDKWGFIRVRGKSVKAPGTYSLMVRNNPAAGLIKKFPDGVFDHVNSAKAAILLHDNNLNLLFDVFGDRIIEDTNLLAEALAGCYNGSPKWTILSLEEYFEGKVADWIDSKYLIQQTREYVIKYRYMAENNLP